MLNLASRIKKRPASFAKALKGQILIMLFQKSSTRTRVSFEAGFSQMGGNAIYLDWEKTNFSLSKIEYEALCLSQNSSILMARLKKHEDILKLAEASSVPVINGCCNKYHPCQILADLLSICEDKGSIKEEILKNIKLTYIGVHNNIANSLMEVALILNIELRLVCPIIPNEILDSEIKTKLLEKNLLKESLDTKEMVKDADYVYTDTWLDLEFFNLAEHAKTKEERIKKMLPYQVNADLMSHSNAKVMHDMPIHLDYEITQDIVESKKSIIFQQAENRIYTQKAILLNLLDL